MSATALPDSSSPPPLTDAATTLPPESTPEPFTPQPPQSTQRSSKSHQGKTAGAKEQVKREKPAPRKPYDPLLDQWYFNEINRRINKDVELFHNYQINPYTKKTLDYVTPKITERKKDLPKYCDCPCLPTPRSKEDSDLCDSYKLVRNAIYKSVNVPKCKFPEPQTELMRLGWFPEYTPPATNKGYMYIKTCWSPSTCCYFYPRNTPLHNENYDERFRAVHQTAEFIRTEAALRAFDAVMNPNGYRGQVRTPRILPRQYRVK